MKFNVSAEMGYEIRSAGTLILNIHALRTPTQVVLEETFTIEPYVKVEELFSVNGENRIIRLEIEKKGNLQINYKATVDNTFEIKEKGCYPDQLAIQKRRIPQWFQQYTNLGI